MIQQYIKHTENLRVLIGDEVRIVQHNNLEIVGTVEEINLPDNQHSIESLIVRQQRTKSTSVGKLKREAGQLVATVYIKNIATIEQL